MRIFSVERVRLLLGVIATAGVLSGCQDKTPSHPDARQAYDMLSHAPVEKPLARINGRDLSAAYFEAFWAENPTLTRDDAIKAWVEQEVLAQHAETVLTQDDGALSFARKQGMVRALLRDEVENKVKFGDEAVDERLEKTRERLSAQMTQPAGVRVSHLLIHVPTERMKPGAQPGDKPEAIPEAERAQLFDTAHEWALKLRATLGDSASLDDLYAAEQRFAGEVAPTLMLAVNAHLSFAVPPKDADAAKPQPSKIPEGWLSVVKEFAVGAAALAGSEPGTISEPVRSDFGWHLIRFEKDFEPIAADSKEVEERARVETIRAERAGRLGDLSGELVEKSTVNLFPQAISEKQQIHSK